MRYIWFVSIIVLLVSGCALPEFLPASTQTSIQPTVIKTELPAKTATITVTQPTPTYTKTPTLVGLSPTITITGDPVSATPSFTLVPFIVDTPTPLILVLTETPGEGFKSLAISGNQIFWGTCKRGSVRITAEVTDPDEVYSVVIFVRLRDAESPDTTPWSKGAAFDNRRNGIFTYDLDADAVSEHGYYMKAWVLYQLVATDVLGKVIGRTKIYTQSLTIEPCK